MQDTRTKSFNLIIEEICSENNINLRYLSKDWVIELSKNGKTKYICGYKFDTAGHGLGEIFDDKYAMYSLLNSHDIPVIEHHIVYSDTNNHSYALDCRGFEYVSRLFKKYNSNVVLKANRGSCGTGVYHVTDLDKLKEIYEHLLSHRPSFSLCPFCDIKNEFRAIQTKLCGRDVKVNPHRYKKPRVTSAEEALLAYLLNHPDKLNYITSQIDESKIQTEFYKKLFVYFCDRIKNGHDPLNTVSGDFTAEESARIFQIANSYSSRVSTEQSLQEYIDVINDEFLKLKTKDVANASIEDIQEQLKRIRESHQ